MTDFAAIKLTKVIEIVLRAAAIVCYNKASWEDLIFFRTATKNDLTGLQPRLIAITS